MSGTSTAGRSSSLCASASLHSLCCCENTISGPPQSRATGSAPLPSAVAPILQRRKPRRRVWLVGADGGELVLMRDGRLERFAAGPGRAAQKRKTHLSFREAVNKAFKRKQEIQDSTSGSIAKELKAGSQRHVCTPMFMAALLTAVNMREQPKCPSVDEKVNKCGLSTRRNITQP